MNNEDDKKYYQFEEKVMDPKNFMNDEYYDQNIETNKVENIKLDMNFVQPKMEVFSKNQFFLPNKNQKYSELNNLIINENNLNNNDLQNEFKKKELEKNLDNYKFQNLENKKNNEEKVENDKILRIKNLLEEIQNNMKDDKEEEKNNNLATGHNPCCPVHGHLVRNNKNVYIPPPYIIQMENQNKINHMYNYQDKKFIPPQPVNPEFYDN